MESIVSVLVRLRIVWLKSVGFVKIIFVSLPWTAIIISAHTNLLLLRHNQNRAMRKKSITLFCWSLLLASDTPFNRFVFHVHYVACELSPIHVLAHVFAERERRKNAEHNAINELNAVALFFAINKRERKKTRLFFRFCPFLCHSQMAFVSFSLCTQFCLRDYVYLSRQFTHQTPKNDTKKKNEKKKDLSGERARLADGPLYHYSISSVN